MAMVDVQESLFKSICLGSIQGVREALAAGADANLGLQWPVRFAVKGSNMKIIFRMLVEHGVTKEALAQVRNEIYEKIRWSCDQRQDLTLDAMLFTCTEANNPNAVSPSPSVQSGVPPYPLPPFHPPPESQLANLPQPPRPQKQRERERERRCAQRVEEEDDRSNTTSTATTVQRDWSGVPVPHPVEQRESGRRRQEGVLVEEERSTCTSTATATATADRDDRHAAGVPSVVTTTADAVPSSPRKPSRGPSPHQNVLLKKLLFSKEFSDVKFEFPNGDSLFANKAILAAACPSYFTKEAFEKAKTEDGMTVFQPEVSFPVMKAVLSFIYTEDMTLAENLLMESTQYHGETFKLAHKYQLATLKEFVVHAMKESLNMKTLKKCLIVSHLQNLTQLKEACFKLVHKKGMSALFGNQVFIADIAGRYPDLWMEMSEFIQEEMAAAVGASQKSSSSSKKRRKLN